MTTEQTPPHPLHLLADLAETLRALDTMPKDETRGLKMLAYARLIREVQTLDPAALRAQAEAEASKPPAPAQKREVFEVHITRIQRLDSLLHEAERWADHSRMEVLLSEAIVLLRGIVYPVGDDPTAPLRPDHVQTQFQVEAQEVQP